MADVIEPAVSERKMRIFLERSTFFEEEFGVLHEFLDAR